MRRLNVLPDTHVQGFFLTPDDFSVRILVGMLLDLLIGEGVELFNTRDGDIVNLVLFTSLQESIVDLTGTHDVLGDLLGFNEMLGMLFGQVELEVGLASQFVQVGLARG